MRSGTLFDLFFLKELINYLYYTKPKDLVKLF